MVLNSQDLFLSYSLAFNLCTAVYFQCPFRWLLSICLFLFQVLGDGLHYDAMSINLFQFLLMSFGSNHTCSPHKNGIKGEVVDSRLDGYILVTWIIWVNLWLHLPGFDGVAHCWVGSPNHFYDFWCEWLSIGWSWWYPCESWFFPLLLPSIISHYLHHFFFFFWYVIDKFY